jgi:hypothetical protein
MMHIYATLRPSPFVQSTLLLSCVHAMPLAALRLRYASLCP